jgi:GntR family transcriptional regulator, transcriptional repressor for pyruvate dehydrogenase complex
MAVMEPSRHAGRVNSAAPGSTQVRVPKTAELVAGHLRRQIVRGDLGEGDALPPESALLETFGVSRPTLREAYRVLESERLLSVRRGSRGGARVHIPKDSVAARYAGLVLEHRGTTLADVYETRAVLEPPCAEMLAATANADDIRRLAAAIDEAEASAAVDPAMAVHKQTDFHGLVVELAGNQTLRVLHGMVQHIIDTATLTRVRRHVEPSDAREAQHSGSRAHQRFLDMVEAGDTAGARRVWETHVRETTKYLLADPGARTVLELLE